MTDWVERKLGDIAATRRGIGYTDATLRTRSEQGVPYLNMKSFLKEGGYNSGGLKYFAGAYAEQDVALASDVLIANTDVTPSGDIIGVPALLPPHLHATGALFSHHVTRIRPAPGLLPTFLHFALCSQSSRRAMLRIARGTTVLMLDAAALKRVVVRFPVETALQQRIASILASLDNAIEATESVIEKHQQIMAGLMQDLFTCGIAATGRVGLRSDGLPPGWRWVPLGSMARVVSGVTLSGGGPANGVVVPYLRVANVQDGYLALEEIKTIRVSRSVLEELRLLPGDVLMNEGGDFDKLGRGTVWSGEIEDCIHQNHVFRVRTDRSVLNPEYLAFHSESHYGKHYFLISSKQSTNLASINATQLRRYPIALPPLDDQVRIVARLSAARAYLVGLERMVAKLRAQKLGLLQDLLTGKVRVPMSEPASA